MAGRLRQQTLNYVNQGQIGEFYTLDLKTGKKNQVTKINDPVSKFNVREKNLVQDDSHPGPPFIEGSAFWLVKFKAQHHVQGKTTIRINGYDDSGKNPDKVRVYDGAFSMGSDYGLNLGSVETPGRMDVFNEVNPDNMTGLGNRAWNKLRPKVEIANLGQTLAEIGQVPQMLKTTSKGFHDIWKNMGGNISKGDLMSPKGIGDQFLNVQFGWKPFLRDMQDTYKVVSDFEAYQQKAVANNDTWTKRRFTEDVVEKEDVLLRRGPSNDNETDPTLYQFVFIEPGSCYQTVTRKEFTRIWYKGVFKSYRPEFDMSAPTVLRDMRQKLSLLGLRISPTLVYKVTPWTWLGDWFYNVGDFVQRVEDIATNSVMSQYFYVMRQKMISLEYRKVFKTKDGQTHDLRWVRSVESKARAKNTNPWGFTTPPGGLSQGQLAIIAALGLSKS